MYSLILDGCGAAPLGDYLKALGVLRLVSEQADPDSRGCWEADRFRLDSELDGDGLIDFFLSRYSPTPILAPWNGGSGFYENDRKIGIDTIAGSTDARFADYRAAVLALRQLPEIIEGKAEKAAEEIRRTAILKTCRNVLSDRAVEWLDAAVGISASGERAFAPVLGTGGNEGRLDYTNNFMERLAALLIKPDKKTPVRDLLASALFGGFAEGLQPAAAGQFDPGRAGGANQGQGIEQDSLTNPWDLVLTLEGAVAWAAGLYRRQGAGYRAFLCSPFTVRATRAGYGSASAKDDARAEIWAPLWHNPTRYTELKVLLREGRADISGRQANTGLEFAEAVCSLGVDRGIGRFVRFNLLKRRGDSYVALPSGMFPAGYRSHSNLIRDIDLFLDTFDQPDSCEDLVRSVQGAMFQALLHKRADRIRDVMAALGRLLRKLTAVLGKPFPKAAFDANRWLDACGAPASVEVRIAAALSSLWDRAAGSIQDNLAGAHKSFAWFGRDLADRMISVLDRRIISALAAESESNAFSGRCRLHPGDVTRFIEGSVDEELIEDLLFAFTCFDWRREFEPINADLEQTLPVYALLKTLFPAEKLEIAGEKKQIHPDAGIVSLLKAENIEDAAERAAARLRVEGLDPLKVSYAGGIDARRVAAALLIPARSAPLLRSAAFRRKEMEAYA